MILRIVHTADNHIGLRFGSRNYPPDLKKALIEERFDALGRVVALANDKRAHLLVVAGDLFDHLHVSQTDIRRTAEILNGFTGIAVVVLPGNHDFFEPGHDTLWEHFRNAMKEQLLLFLERSAPVDLSIEDRAVVFYPGPCTSKHSREHAIGWVQAVEKKRGALHIGIAHGSVPGVSPDLADAYFPMPEEVLRESGVDFWLLGHTHVRYPAQPHSGHTLFFIPSTHTPDGFDCAHEGYAWYLEVDDARHVRMESVRTGVYRFLDWERPVHSSVELERCRAELDALDHAKTLLKLRFHGRLSEEELADLATLSAEIDGRFAYVEIDRSAVLLKITQESINRCYSQNSLPHRLLTLLAKDPHDQLALQLAHDLIEEVRS